MLKLEKRDVFISLLLSVLSFGLYGIYWMYLLVKNTYSLQGKSTENSIGDLFCIFLVPFYSWYWWYTRGRTVRKYLDANGEKVHGTAVAYLILDVFGLGIISMALMQWDFNSAFIKPCLERRGILLIFLLSIFSYGILGICWMYLLVRDTRKISGKSVQGSIWELICLFIIPFYSWYWWYTRGEMVKNQWQTYCAGKVSKKRCGNGAFYLVLDIFWLGLFSMLVMQDDLNCLAEAAPYSNDSYTPKFHDTVKVDVAKKEPLYQYDESTITYHGNGSTTHFKNTDNADKGINNTNYYNSYNNYENMTENRAYDSDYEIKKEKSPYPPLFVGAFWVLYALIFPLYAWYHILLCAILSVGVYFIAAKIFPDNVTKIAKEKSYQASGDEELDQALKEASAINLKIRRLADSIQKYNSSLAEDARTLVYKSDKILELLTKKPEDYRLARRFFSYYLPTTEKLLNSYVEFKVNGSAAETVAEIEQTVPQMKGVFQNQIDKLLSDKELDISTDIDVLETKLKSINLD